MKLEKIPSSTDIVPLTDVTREDLPSHVLSNIKDMALEIFSYLDMYDLLSLAQVNKNIKILSGNNSLWKKILEEIKHYTQISFVELPPEMSIKEFINDYFSKYRPFLLSKKDALDKMEKFLENFDYKVSNSEFECIFPFTTSHIPSSQSRFLAKIILDQPFYKTKKVSFFVLEKINVASVALPTSIDNTISKRIDSQNMHPYISKPISADLRFSNIHSNESDFQQNSLSILEKCLQKEINKEFQKLI